MSEVTPAEQNGSPLSKELKSIEFDGYKFDVNLDLIDDVEAIDMLDQIENKQNLKAIVEFLKYLVGADGYEKMKAFFVERDGRFRLTKLSGVYKAIFENFDPKE